MKRYVYSQTLGTSPMESELPSHELDQDRQKRDEDVFSVDYEAVKERSAFRRRER